MTLQTSHSYYTPAGATPGDKPAEKAEPGEKLPLDTPAKPLSGAPVKPGAAPVKK